MAKSKLKLEPNKKKGVAKASLANLRPAKKGEVRNPEGSRTHNPLTRALQKTTNESFATALSIAFESKEGELEAFVEDPETPMLQKFVAQAMLKAFENNDHAFVQSIADRLVGKVSETMTINQNTNSQVTAQVSLVTDAGLKGRLAKIREDV